MSTETIETVPDYRERETAFLPAAPGVLYEFLAVGSETALLGARELQPGGTYEMVVSHGYGLRRYATGDLFRVERVVAGLPDLRFLGRRGLGWSFTGEKLTAEQIGVAFEALHAEYPGLRDGFWLALFPEDPGGGALPLLPPGGGRPGGGASPGACPKASRNDSMNFSGIRTSNTAPSARAAASAGSAARSSGWPISFRAPRAKAPPTLIPSSSSSPSIHVSGKRVNSLWWNPGERRER